MATVKSFEELEIWQMARALANRIYPLTLEGSFAKDFELRNQINSSSGSVMDNIAEGFERGGNKEFISFLSYAKGSAGETRSQLYRAHDRNHINDKSFNELSEEVRLLARKIGGLMTYLQKSDLRGSKFHEPDISY